MPGATLHGELAAEGIHVGTVTVDGAVAPGTAYGPDLVAEAFWSLHRDPPGGFRPEIVFRG